MLSLAKPYYALGKKTALNLHQRGHVQHRHDVAERVEDVDAHRRVDGKNVNKEDGQREEVELGAVGRVDRDVAVGGCRAVEDFWRDFEREVGP